MSRKTTAYARKIRRTGPGFNGAAWMNTMERCRPYTDEPILPCSPAQMSNAGKVRMDVIAGKRSKIIEAPQRSNA